LFLVFPLAALADEELSLAVAYYSIDNIVLLVCAILVLFMQAGFAALESGMSPMNNTVNIMFKNFTDLCVGVLLFYFVGYSIMYGNDVSGGLGLLGWGGFGISSELGDAPCSMMSRRATSGSASSRNMS
jgi:Amt family ammonium transporter